MPVVNYNKDNALTIRGEHGLKFRFLPGANEVPLDVWEGLQGNESLQAFKDRGVLAVVMIKPPKAPTEKPSGLQRMSEPAPETKVVESKELGTLNEADIGKMDAWSAIALVESVTDLDHLKRFDEQEKERKGGPRKTVVESLKTHIEAMTPADKE